MGILDRLFPWYDPKEEDMKDARAELVTLKGQKATSHVKKLAQQGRAAGLIMEKVKHPDPKTQH